MARLALDRGRVLDGLAGAFQLVPPCPANHFYPDTPILVLVGDLDSITSPEGAEKAASFFPNSTFVEVASVAHVTALVD